MKSPIKGTRMPGPADKDYESPNWYAVKETAKEMWNAQDFVPAKQKLITRIREMGPKEAPYESPNWDATKQLAAEFTDSILPNNPTQLAADLAGTRLVGAAAKGIQALRRGQKLKGLKAERAAERAEKAAFEKQHSRELEARDMVRKGLAEDEEEALEQIQATDVFDYLK